MLLDDYEKALERMGLTEVEQKLTQFWPAPIAFGFHMARRRDNGGRRDYWDGVLGKRA
jgi:hypothetical protein